MHQPVGRADQTGNGDPDTEHRHVGDRAEHLATHLGGRADHRTHLVGPGLVEAFATMVHLAAQAHDAGDDAVHIEHHREHSHIEAR